MQARVMRQALAGMLWSKQYFDFDVHKWLEEHGVRSDAARPRGHAEQRMVPHGEPAHHLDAGQVGVSVVSPRGTWRSTAIALSTVDMDFAKDQLDLMLRVSFFHPTGQIPAYEWNFSDVNPPVHAWATIFLYRTEQALQGKGDLDFLQAVLSKADAELHLVGEPQRPLRQ